MVIAAPLFHSWGFFHFVLSLPTASTLVLRRRFDPEETLQAVAGAPRRGARRRPGDAAADPAAARRDARPRTTSPRCGSPRSPARRCPGELAIEWMDRFGDNVYNLYGSTEVAWATIATPEDLRAAPGTAGRPPRGTVVQLFDEDGKRGPPGRGRADLRRQRNGLRGLHRRRRQGGRSTACSRSGDVGHFDEAGRLFIDGRDDEMIVSGGENVFPREVEDLLADHEAVVEVAVIGVDDEEFGQRLKAFVVLDEGAERSRGRAQGPRQGEPRLLQGPARGRVPRRAAAQRDRQGPQARAARARAGAEELGLSSERSRKLRDFRPGRGWRALPATVVVCGAVSSAASDAASRRFSSTAVSEADRRDARDRRAGARVGAGQRGARQASVPTAEAERARSTGDELKERAMETLRKLGDEGRERIAAERDAAQGRRGAAPTARRRRATGPRRPSSRRAARPTRRPRGAGRGDDRAQGAIRSRTLAEPLKRLRSAEAEKRPAEAIDRGPRAAPTAAVAAAEQRAAEAEAAAEEARRIAVRIEAEIEERVMQGTEDVRREAEERVRAAGREVRGRSRGDGPAPAPRTRCEAESDRIRKQAEQREERARRAAEDEIKASAGTGAARSAWPAAEETAPSWAERTSSRAPPGQRLPDLLDLRKLRPRCARCGSRTR